MTGLSQIHDPFPDTVRTGPDPIRQSYQAAPSPPGGLQFKIIIGSALGILSWHPCRETAGGSGG